MIEIAGGIASTLILRPRAPEIKQIVGRPVGRVAHAGEHLQVLERGLALLDDIHGGTRRDEAKQSRMMTVVTMPRTALMLPRSRSVGGNTGVMGNEKRRRRQSKQ